MTGINVIVFHQLHYEKKLTLPPLLALYYWAVTTQVDRLKAEGC